MVKTEADIWVALYVLLLDYVSGVPRITDSNRLNPKKPDAAWVRRAKQVEVALAHALGCPPPEVPNRVDQFMRNFYPPGVQRMNPIGIALASAAIYLIDRFAGDYRWKTEARIRIDIFPNLSRLKFVMVA